VIWVFGKPEYFFKGGWTGKSDRSPSGKSLHNEGVRAARRFSHALSFLDFVAGLGLLLAKS
jgi:hypothetical protein